MNKDLALKTSVDILRRRHWPYRRWVAAIVLWQAAAQFLFAACGASGEPERKGLIIQMLHQRFGDSFEVAIVVLVISPGGVFIFLHKFNSAAKGTGEG